MKQKNKQPKLRFPQFDGDWEEKRLGDLFKSLRTGSTPSRYKPEFFTGNIPWITSGELNYNIITSTYESVSEEAIRATNLKIYPKGTFFIAITGLEAPGTRGKCAINGIPATTNQSCLAFEAIPTLKNIFLFYWYTNYGVRLYFRFAQGTKQQSFNNEIVKSFKIHLPSLAEQEKIADFFSTLDTYLGQKKQRLGLLQEYKRGMMQQLFSGQKRFQPDAGGEFPAWKKVRLGDQCNFYKGKGISKQDLVVDGEISCIRYGELYTVYQEVITHVFSKTNGNRTSFIFSRENDVIIPASGESQLDIATASCVLDDNIAIGGDINIIRPKSSETINGIFLAYCLNSVQKKSIAKLAQGISVIHLYPKHLKQIKISLPSIAEQKKIAEFLEAVDDRIKLVEQSVAQLESWKKGLLQELLV